MGQPTKAVIYARFSPRRGHSSPAAEAARAENGEKLCESCEAQIELCRAHCAKEGWQVVAEFDDKAISGDEEDEEKRPGLWAAIEALKKGYVLVVYRLDRLARKWNLSFIIERDVAKKRARIVSIKGEGTGGETDEDQLMRRMLQAFAEYDKKVKAARTSDLMLRHQATGRRMSSRCPFGWRPDPGRPGLMLTEDSEQATILFVCELATQGHGLREIARMLSERGIACRGKGWNHKLVKRILQRAAARQPVTPS